MEELFDGDMVLRRPRAGREERFLSLPKSEVLTRAIQYVNSILRGCQVGQAADGGRPSGVSKGVFWLPGNPLP